MQKKQQQIEQKIKKIKLQLQEIGAMRPGALNQQFSNKEEKKGGFWQLSYTHKMKGHTEYVRKPFLPQIKAEAKEYRKFRKLMESWVELSIELSQLKIAIAKQISKN